MADTKISALPASTVPLAGTEVLPIVQSSSTKQVSVANLTAGRSFDALGMTLTSTDAGAAAAPLLELYRDSASPAANDTLGEIEFNGEDSAGNKQAYALFHGSILSPTSGSEQGQLHFETATAGALTEKMIIGTTNLVINEIGAVFNVRIEGDTDANLFTTDATNSRVGIGTLSPASKLEVAGDARVSTGNFVVGTSGQGVTSGNFALGLGANGSTTAASIDTSGNLLVGATSVLGTSAAGSTHITGGANTTDQTPLYLRNANATAGQYWKVGPTNNSGFVIFDPSNNGQYQTYGGVFWLSTSDERKKDIIEPITNAVYKVSTLRAVIGKFKVDPEGTRRSFLLAQDVQAVLPEAVDATDPENLGVSYSEVIPLLVAAIKELKAEFDAYKASHSV